MFNRFPKAIPMLTSCSVVGFKSQLDSYVRNIVGLPCQPGFNNSLVSSDTTIDMIYMDFVKVFDKVDHGVLLHKLKDLGITGRLAYGSFSS